MDYGVCFVLIATGTLKKRQNTVYMEYTTFIEMDIRK